MNDPFTMRLRAAVVAGWWTVLITVGFVTLLWIANLVILAIKPAWLLSLWGPDITWSDAQHVILWVIVAFKFVLWLMVLTLVWLTLWGWQLRKQA